MQSWSCSCVSASCAGCTSGCVHLDVSTWPVLGAQQCLSSSCPGDPKSRTCPDSWLWDLGVFTPRRGPCGCCLWDLGFVWQRSTNVPPGFTSPSVLFVSHRHRFPRCHETYSLQNREEPLLSARPHCGGSSPALWPSLAAHSRASAPRAGLVAGTASRPLAPFGCCCVAKTVSDHWFPPPLLTSFLELTFVSWVSQHVIPSMGHIPNSPP